MATPPPDTLRAALEARGQNLLALGRTMVEPRPDNREPLLGERIAAVVNGLFAIRDARAALQGDADAPPKVEGGFVELPPSDEPPDEEERRWLSR